MAETICLRHRAVNLLYSLPAEFLYFLRSYSEAIPIDSSSIAYAVLYLLHVGHHNFSINFMHS